MINDNGRKKKLNKRRLKFDRSALSEWPQLENGGRLNKKK